MRITFSEIDLEAFKYNVRLIKEKISPAVLLATVKANAYGHGITEISKAAVEAGAEYLGVGFLEEGISLRKKGIKAPILVLGGVLFSQIRRFLRYNLEITVSSLELAYRVNNTAGRHGCPAKIHLKFDTGMNRIGINYLNAAPVLERLVNLKHLQVKGLYSHLATADCPDKGFVDQQVARFKEIVNLAKEMGINPGYAHIANSAAACEMPSSYFDMVRGGMLLYGVYPSKYVKTLLPVKPVMSLKSRVIFLKKVKAGEGISYGHNYIICEPTTIATVPIGYGDGYNRLLSNRGEVLIRGRRFPIVGTICMDQLMVDVRGEQIKIGDEVVLYGRQGDEEITIDQVAEQLNTIPYEITCWVASRVPRIFRRNSG